MALLSYGNGKLGRTIAHFDLPAGSSCPGATPYCELHCYAKKGNYRRHTIKDRYARLFELAQDPDLLYALLDLELTEARPPVVRIHSSGDFFSVAYIEMWAEIAIGHPQTRFYAYTRSWRVPSLLGALERLRALHNVTLWASTDPTSGPAPAGWPKARLVNAWADAPAMAHCPEQTGKRKSCQDCGLCWNPNLRPSARLAFIMH